MEACAGTRLAATLAAVAAAVSAAAEPAATNAATAVREPAAWESLRWDIPPYATLDGAILSIDVPQKAVREGCRVTADIDLSAFDDTPLEATIEAWGEGIAAPRHPWNGLKFQFEYRDADSGEMRYPNTAPILGDFGRQTLAVRDPACAGRAVPARFVLGLQDTCGKVSFDLSTLAIRAGRIHWPITNQAHRCEYTFARKERPLRGVMSPSRDMTEDDFATLASWGATLLRYQMVRRGLSREEARDLDIFDKWLDGRLDHFESVILPMCRKYGIMAVLDLHSAPGGSEEASETHMLHDAECAAHFVKTWRRIALRFRGNADAIYGYDLINEPVQKREALPGCDFWSLQSRAAEAIREIDAKTPIIVECNGMDHPEYFGSMSPLVLPDIIYEVHFYNPSDFTHQGANGPFVDPKQYPDAVRGWDRDFMRRVVAPVREFEKRHGARIYVGEFSATAWSPGAADWLRDAIAIFNEYGWDWTYHAFREWNGWSVEHEGRGPRQMSSSADNPRKRALLEGFSR